MFAGGNHAPRCTFSALKTAWAGFLAHNVASTIVLRLNNEGMPTSNQHLRKRYTSAMCSSGFASSAQKGVLPSYHKKPADRAVAITVLHCVKNAERPRCLCSHLVHTLDDEVWISVGQRSASKDFQRTKIRCFGLHGTPGDHPSHDWRSICGRSMLFQRDVLDDQIERFHPHAINQRPQARVQHPSECLAFQVISLHDNFFVLQWREGRIAKPAFSFFLYAAGQPGFCVRIEEVGQVVSSTVGIPVARDVSQQAFLFREGCGAQQGLRMSVVLGRSRPRQTVPDDQWIHWFLPLALAVCICFVQPFPCCIQHSFHLLVVELQRFVVFEEHQAVVQVEFEQIGCCDCVWILDSTERIHGCVLVPFAEIALSFPTALSRIVAGLVLVPKRLWFVLSIPVVPALLSGDAVGDAHHVLSFRLCHGVLGQQFVAHEARAHALLDAKHPRHRTHATSRLLLHARELPPRRARAARRWHRTHPSRTSRLACVSTHATCSCDVPTWTKHEQDDVWMLCTCTCADVLRFGAAMALQRG